MGAAALLLCLATEATAAPFVHLHKTDPTIAQDMRYAGADNFTGKPLPGYDAAECLLLPAVAQALKRVQADIASRNLALKVYDCYRPTRAVAAMAVWARSQSDTGTARFYPALQKSNLFKRGYIAHRSAHSRGVAIDLTLVPRGSAAAAFDRSKSYGSCTAPQAERAPDNSLDMGTGYDCFDVKSHTASAAITPRQSANRKTLRDAMRRHGFSNYKREWWHFSYDGADGSTAYDMPIAAR